METCPNHEEGGVCVDFLPSLLLNVLKLVSGLSLNGHFDGSGELLEAECTRQWWLRRTRSWLEPEEQGTP